MHREQGRAEVKTLEKCMANKVRNLDCELDWGTKFGIWDRASVRLLNVFRQDWEPLRVASALDLLSSLHSDPGTGGIWNKRRNESEKKLQYHQESSNFLGTDDNGEQNWIQSLEDNWIPSETRKIKSSYQKGKMRLVNKTTGWERRQCGSEWAAVQKSRGGLVMQKNRE